MRSSRSASLLFLHVVGRERDRTGALVGAFAAGLVLEDVHRRCSSAAANARSTKMLQPMTSFLVPVFFVLVGFRADIRILAHPTALAVPLALTAAAVAGKLLCGVGVRRPGHQQTDRRVGMIPRGEVALVFAALGSTYKIGELPLLDQNGYTAIVTVVILTTLITPRL